jgi:uncharacterized protein (TIGR02646 family)
VKHVTRTRKPDCLSKNALRWREDLLAAIATADANLIKRRRSRYNHPEVRTGLNSMYRNLCCYCESPVGEVRADEIEHRRPVDRFPRYAFEWNNLHLACSGCNGSKSNKWDSTHPVLDAVTDSSIENHLTYECSETGVRQTWLTLRGRTTVDHAQLNRPKLREARNAAMINVVGLIQTIRNRLKADPADITAANHLGMLDEMYRGHYGSMIRWAVATLLEA